MNGGKRPTRPGTRLDGFSLVEVMVAAFLLITISYGVSRYYIGGRRQLDNEENRRQATAILQDRLDGIRRDHNFDNLMTLNGTTTNFVVGSKTYTISYSVVAFPDSLQADSLRLTVTWPVTVGATTLNRTLSTVTILARGMP